MSRIEEFLKLVQENPDLPIIPMVDSEVVCDDTYTYWMGRWGPSVVTEYYVGKERIHFRNEDEEDVLSDMADCKCYCTPDGRDITDLSEEEWNALYRSILWKKAIVVYVTTPDDLW